MKKIAINLETQKRNASRSLPVIVKDNYLLSLGPPINLWFQRCQTCTSRDSPKVLKNLYIL